MKPDEPNAASSAATEVEEVAEPVEVEELSTEQRDAWLESGDLPEKKSATKTPEASSASKPAAATDEGAGKDPESGTGKKNKTEERFQELLRDRKAEKERGDRLEAELADLRKKLDGGGDKKDDKKEASSAQEPKAPELPKRPRLADFDTHEAYEDAMDAYEKERDEYPAKKAAFDTWKASFEKNKADFEALNKRLKDHYTAVREKGKAIYEDFDKVGLGEIPVPEGESVERYLRDSEPEMAAHLLQYFGLNTDHLKEINGMTQRQAIKALEVIEELIAAEVTGGSKAPAKTTKKKNPDDKPAKREVTQAKAPPREVGGSGTAAGDEEEEALRVFGETGDPTRYMQVANRRDAEKKTRKK